MRARTSARGMSGSMLSIAHVAPRASASSSGNVGSARTATSKPSIVPPRSAETIATARSRSPGVASIRKSPS